MLKTTIMKLAVLVLCAGLAAAGAGCDDGAKAAKGGPGGGRKSVQFPVEVRPVEVRDVEYGVHATGTIDVFERVQITARVAGVVDKVGFREGALVAKGAVLATIEPARYELAARTARSARDRAKAALADAEAGLARRETADTSHPGLIPGEEVEAWRTKVATARADLAERTVAVDRAALDLRDAYVRAPVAGIVQTRTIDPGGYAQVGTVLASMVRRDPMVVRFDVAEGDSTRINRGQTIKVGIGDGGEPVPATVSHVAEVADPQSRMVPVVAEFTPEVSSRLRAGGFAEVTIPVGGRGESPVIAESAVRPSERGFLAFVVEDGVAHERILELGLRTADGLVEVKKGLAAGEALVVRGGEALRQGAEVIVGTPGKGDKGGEGGKPPTPATKAPDPTGTGTGTGTGAPR